METARTPEERKPILMLAAERKLRKQRPVTQRSTRDMEICATTRRLRRDQKGPARARRSSPLRAEGVRRQAVVQAGRRPKRTPVTRLRTKVKARTLASTPTLRSIETGTGKRKAESPPVAQTEMRMPSAPPRRESSVLSVRTWRRSWRRVAPRATRTAISRWRAAAFARKRLATLAQAIRKTKKTTSMRVERKRRTIDLSRGGSAQAGSKWKPRSL